MRDTRGETDLKEGIHRLTAVLEVVRSELGNLDPDQSWRGLSRRLAEGAEETRGFARQVAGDGLPGSDEVVFRLFSVRQSEISLSILSKVLDRIDELNSRIEALERQLRPGA